ncbi:MAG: PadR family transcriptional regulator [Acidobacteria bacterium]|nr:PadR family transcriptional regulator [Acidobacteriota bacterium]
MFTDLFRDSRERCFARRPGGGWHDRFDARRGGPGGWFAGGRERLFEAGDIKLVILKLLSEEPSYGYQLMKTMEERLAGGYAPSAGVIYPTLTMLEEAGLIVASSSEGARKTYSVTPEGSAHLSGAQHRVKQLFERLEEAGRGFERGRHPEIMKAFLELRDAVMARAARGRLSEDQIRQAAEIIAAAARAIDEL